MPNAGNADTPNIDFGTDTCDTNAGHTNADWNEVASIPSTREVTSIVYMLSFHFDSFLRV